MENKIKEKKAEMLEEEKKENNKIMKVPTM